MKTSSFALPLLLITAFTLAMNVCYAGNGNSNVHLTFTDIALTTQDTKPVSDSTDGSITPITNTAALMPKHGTVSIAPAKQWEDALAAGNGTMGAMLYGDPRNDTVLVNHCKLWLPAGSREQVPDVGEFLPEMRRIIGEKGYQTGQDFMLDRMRDKGWPGHLIWTDVFHPGFFLNIRQPQPGEIHDYARVENFATGEVWTQWSTSRGSFARRMFVSRPDNAIVITTTGPKGSVSLDLAMQPLGNDGIEGHITHATGWITAHNVYVHGKGGYDAAIRVIAKNGSQSSNGQSVSVKDADSVTLIMRILPYRTPLQGSQAWPNSPDNPDFAGEFHHAERTSVQVTGKEYDSRWMTELKDDLESMSSDYSTLLKPHAKAWGKLFDRVTIDLNAPAPERGLSSEALLDLAQKEQRLPAALLERMYDAGRYVFLCSAGPQTPPNLFGIWSGTWKPAWSGDYTTDTNLQLDTELAYSANLAECMDGYFNLWDSYLPDFRRNAHNLYGCSGILTGSRASNNGLALHYGGGWPGNLWTPGASWIAHWYYDHYEYTGDREFLRTRAIPYMKECALFWEDFLRGTEDASGHYTFRPSFSAENGWGDNASQDIEITHELLTNLIAGCETLGIEKDGVARWKTMLAKLPPLLINNEGQLKEWSNPTQGEKNDHRHLMHLYGAFESAQFSEEDDPKLFAAAIVALNNRIAASEEDATHGFMHTALAATGLGMGDVAFARVEKLAKLRSIYPSMVDAHYGGPRVLCDDGNGATPEIVNRMIIQSRPGRLSLLPALPAILPQGTLRGTRARGNILINEIAWNMPAGTISASITSNDRQSITLVFPSNITMDTLSVDGIPHAIIMTGIHKQRGVITLAAKKTVAIHASFHTMRDDAMLPFAPGARILFQGDSITDGGRWRSDDPNHILGQDYAYLIAARCGGHYPEKNWAFLNRGVSGNTVTDLATRWQTDTIELKSDILSVLIGVNDSMGAIGKGGTPAGSDDFEKTYDQILQQAVDANPKVKLVLCEPFILPNGHVLEHPDLWQSEVKLRREAVERLAAKYHAPAVHFQKVFDDAAKRAPIAYWIWDGIHPTYASHQLMADEWLRVVGEFYGREGK